MSVDPACVAWWQCRRTGRPTNVVVGSNADQPLASSWITSEKKERRQYISPFYSYWGDEMHTKLWDIVKTSVNSSYYSVCQYLWCRPPKYCAGHWTPVFVSLHNSYQMTPNPINIWGTRFNLWTHLFNDHPVSKCGDRRLNLGLFGSKRLGVFMSWGWIVFQTLLLPNEAAPRWGLID